MSKKKPYNGRDYLLLKIIGGATKAGVEVDRKKEANKTTSRRNKMTDNKHEQQQSTMQLQELKALKSTLAELKATIERLTTQNKELMAELATLSKDDE